MRRIRCAATSSSAAAAYAYQIPFVKSCVCPTSRLLLWNASLLPTVHIPIRFASSTASSSGTPISSPPHDVRPPSGSSSSAVNVEAFTLNEEVVKKDLEYMQKWNDVAQRMDEERRAKDYAALLKQVQGGLDLLEEVGPQNAPIQCETLLCLEGAQAYIHLKQLPDALEMVKRAKEGLVPRTTSRNTNDKTSTTRPTDGHAEKKKDMIAFSECQLLHAHILILQNQGKEAEEIAKATLQWLEGEGKGQSNSHTVSPIQAVGALHLKRSAMTTVGRALVCQARALLEKGNDTELHARTLSGKALDILIDALNGHIEEKDHESVKMTLENIFFCFEGLEDWKQAGTTCRKYIAWCQSKKDVEGVKYGEEMLSSLLKRHPEHENEITAG